MSHSLKLLQAAGLLALVMVATASSTVMSFEEFMRLHSKKYASLEELEYRRSVYRSNMARAALLNNAKSPAAFGTTIFSDRTPAEFAKTHRVLKREEPATPSYEFSDRSRSSVPAVVDWRDHGAVTPVPNQGQCGSIICGFGFATNTEGVNKIVNGRLIALSAQEGMACYEETCGCYLRGTYEWFLKNQSGWVDTEASWPYNESQCEVAVCDLKDRTKGAHIDQVVFIPNSENAIEAEVAVGPVTVAVMADNWDLYQSGVFTTCGWGQPDHVVTIVGYNNAASAPYWILKNWWGVDWGMKGYMYLAKGSNQCNITNVPLTVRVPVSK